MFLRQALAGETIRIYGTGEQRRDFNYVDDVVDALLLAAESDRLLGQSFNLGHAEHVQPDRVRRDAGSVRAVSAASACRSRRTLAAIDIGDYYGEFAAFAAATGWSPRIDLADGLARTVDWFRDPGRRARRG